MRPRRNADERARRRWREARLGGVEERLRAESEVLRLEGIGGAWRTRVPMLRGVDAAPIEWDSNFAPLLILDNDPLIYPARKRVERYLLNKLIVGDYDNLEAHDLWAQWARSSTDLRREYGRRVGLGQIDRAGMEALARFLDQARFAWVENEIEYTLTSTPLVHKDEIFTRRVRENAKKPPPTCDPSSRPLPDSALGQRVRVHLNLHNGCYVASKKGKVLGYSPSLELRDVTSSVSMSGYRRCREEQTRNVHAWLEGVLASADPAQPGSPEWRRLSYNCLTAPPCFFYVDTHSCFSSAEEVRCFQGGKVWAR